MVSEKILDAFDKNAKAPALTLLFFSFITILAVGFTLRYIRADRWMDGVPLLFSGSCHGCSHSFLGKYGVVWRGGVLSCLV